MEFCYTSVRFHTILHSFSRWFSHTVFSVLFSSGCSQFKIIANQLFDVVTARRNCIHPVQMLAVTLKLVKYISSKKSVIYDWVLLQIDLFMFHLKSIFISVNENSILCPPWCMILLIGMMRMFSLVDYKLMYSSPSSSRIKPSMVCSGLKQAKTGHSSASSDVPYLSVPLADSSRVVWGCSSHPFGKDVPTNSADTGRSLSLIHI